jgi:hypothetical protein
MSKLSINSLFPSGPKPRGNSKKLDLETLFPSTLMNHEPDISFSPEILLERNIEKRKKKLLFYKSMLKYCYEKIVEGNNHDKTDILFKIVDNYQECPFYSPDECIEFISEKLIENKLEISRIEN